jgi:hypothetical protein
MPGKQSNSPEFRQLAPERRLMTRLSGLPLPRSMFDEGSGEAPSGPRKVLPLTSGKCPSTDPSSSDNRKTTAAEAWNLPRLPKSRRIAELPMKEFPAVARSTIRGTIDNRVSSPGEGSHTGEAVGGS